MVVGTVERGWEAGSWRREGKEGKAAVRQIWTYLLGLPLWSSTRGEEREGGERMNEWRACGRGGEGGTGVQGRWSELHGTLLFLLGWLLHTYPHGHICHMALKSCHIPGSGAKEGHGTRGKTAGQRSEVREGIQVKRTQPVTEGWDTCRMRARYC